VPSAPSIVLVDADWIALSRLREIIEQNFGFAVAAACRCADGAMLAVERYRPAAVILDVRLPDRDGVELIRDIIATSGAKVIVFTMALQKEEIVRVLRSGAEAIVFKDQTASVLVSCVRQAFHVTGGFKGRDFWRHERSYATGARSRQMRHDGGTQ
jgi:two-component system uhpT operon response regulator UhpA